MAAPFDVCIRGAGVVGRTLALLLARERLHVGLVEAPASDMPDVRAYALNAASRELLSALRAWPDEPEVTPVLLMEVHGDEGGEVHFRAEEQGAPALSWIADARVLNDLLGQALRFQPLVEMLDAPSDAALTIVCEGRASATRAEFGVQFETLDYGQHAIAARLICEKPHAQAARQWFHEGDVLALLPMGGPQGNSAALVWSVRQDRARELMALAPEEFQAQLETASRGELGRLTLTSERLQWPLQLARASRWCGPGWALAGDAAHVVHPLAGQGLNLGLADAKTLAQTLREREYWRPLGDERLLRRYERARKADVAMMQWATDGLQRLFAQEKQPWVWLRNWGMRGFEYSGPLKHWVARQAAGRL